MRIEAGDNAEVLPRLAAEGVLVDSVVTDPPYHLTSIVKRFGQPNSAAVKVPENGTGVYARGSKGFMGKAWDGGDVAFQPETWARIMAVMKPGAHLLAFGGTRTFARMAVAIEDAGFEVRDTVAWVYGSGFPKSHDVGKGIDKAAGAKRDVVGRAVNWGGRPTIGPERHIGEWSITAPATPEAQQWDGWGTALKPAMELICLARKPLSEKTVAKNVLKHGTGALNIDGCRVGTERPPTSAKDFAAWRRAEGRTDAQVARPDTDTSKGRWPANLTHDVSEEVLAGFPDGEARFFYTAKAATAERESSKHPTVKPLDLMRWLVRLVTPPKGVVLDPFAGSGTTGVAAICEGMDAILIERETEYLADIERRIAAAQGTPKGTETEPGLFA